MEGGDGVKVAHGFKDRGRKANVIEAKIVRVREEKRFQCFMKQNKEVLRAGRNNSYSFGILINNLCVPTVNFIGKG